MRDEIRSGDTRPSRLPRGLLAAELSTDGLAAGDRFEWWREQFRSLHEVRIDPETHAGFVARARHWQLGPIRIGHYLTPKRSVVRTMADSRRDGVDDLVLRVAPAAGLVSCTGAALLRAQRGQIVLGTFAADYHDDYEAGEWITAILPRAAIAGAVPGDVQAAVLASPLSRVLADFLVSIVRVLPDSEAAEREALADIALAMVASVLARPRPSAAPDDRWMLVRARVEQIVRANIGSTKLDVERICTLACISRSTLYRAFEEKGGVARYVAALRLDRIHADLLDGTMRREPIAHIAARNGWHNETSLSRAFRRRFGCSPSDLRRGEATVERPLSSRERARRLVDLLS